MQTADDLGMDLSDAEINQAVMDLKHFGVCRADALYGLMTRQYVEVGKKWFKPIPWAIEYASLNVSGHLHAIAIKARVKGGAGDQPAKTDPFQPCDIGSVYTGHLVFSTVRIEAVIEAGQHIELARAGIGDVALLKSNAAMHQAHPEIFPNGVVL